MNDPHARAFVVWFEPEAEVAPERFRGRAEHVASGQVARFHSPDELLAILRRMLSWEKSAEGKAPG